MFDYNPATALIALSLLKKGIEAQIGKAVKDLNITLDVKKKLLLYEVPNVLPEIKGNYVSSQVDKMFFVINAYLKFKFKKGESLDYVLINITDSKTTATGFVTDAQGQKQKINYDL